MTYDGHVNRLSECLQWNERSEQRPGSAKEPAISLLEESKKASEEDVQAGP